MPALTTGPRPPAVAVDSRGLGERRDHVGRVALQVCLLSIALFVVATVGVALGWGARIDRKAFVLFVAGDDADPAARFLEYVAQLASPIATAAVLAALAAGVGLRRVPARLLLATVAGLAAVTAVELALKTWLSHSGPPAVYHHQLQTLTILYANSFPSGHAARSLVLGAAVILASPARARAVAGILVGPVVAVILVSRLYLGEHWISDVIGGVLLGTAAVALMVASRGTGRAPR